MVVSGSGEQLGNYEAPINSSIRFQIDIWTKEERYNEGFTINGIKYYGEYLAEYIAYKITEAFDDYMSDFYPVMYNYILLSTPRDLPFDIQHQCHHKTVEFMMSCLKIGRIE